MYVSRCRNHDTVNSATLFVFISHCTKLGVAKTALGNLLQRKTVRSLSPYHVRTAGRGGAHLSECVSSERGSRKWWRGGARNAAANIVVVQHVDELVSCVCVADRQFFFFFSKDHGFQGGNSVRQ